MKALQNIFKMLFCGENIFPVLFKIDLLWVLGVFYHDSEVFNGCICPFSLLQTQRSIGICPHPYKNTHLIFSFKNVFQETAVVNSIWDNLTNHPTKMSHKILKIQDNQLGKGELLSSIHDAQNIYKCSIKMRFRKTTETKV